MSAAGLPTIHVTLDDGTGTFPYDITTKARLKDGYKITRGRSDELATVQPGNLTLTLDNSDGRFTLGSATYGIHADQRIRVTVIVGATTSDRFTGYVQAWPVNWPDGSDAFSTVMVTATDTSARWPRHTMRALLEEEILASNPAAYYPMTEPAGAIAASDVSGKAQPQMTNTPGSPVVFGTAPAPGIGDTTGAQFDTVPGAAYLRAGGMSPIGGAGLFYLECAFMSPGVPDQHFSVVTGRVPGASDDSVRIYIQSATGFVGMQVTTTAGGTVFMTSTVNVADAKPHHVAFVSDGATLRLYLDGVQILSSTITGFTPSSGFTYLAAGEHPATGSAGFANVIAHVAGGTSISTSDIADHAAALFTGLAGETSDVRIDRLIGYEGTLTSTVGDTGLVLMPAQATTGKTVGDAVQSVVDAELGLLWINGSGQAQYANKDHVALATSPAMTIALSSDMVDPGTGFSVDMQQVTNTVTGQREGGDVTQVFMDQASIDTHGEYSASPTWLVQTDREVEGRSQWLISKYAEPSPRLPTLGLDLLTADAANQVLALGLDLDSHIKVTGWPAQSPAGANTDLVAEGYTETLSDTAWELVLNCASWNQQSVFILDDPVFGILDTSPLGI